MMLKERPFKGIIVRHPQSDPHGYKSLPARDGYLEARTARDTVRAWNFYHRLKDLCKLRHN